MRKHIFLLFSLLCLLLAGCGNAGQAGGSGTGSPPVSSGPAASAAASNGEALSDSSLPAPEGSGSASTDAPEGPLTAPPELHVAYLDETLTTEGWNWTWTVLREDGTTDTLSPEYATAYPLDWVDLMDTLTRGGGDSVTLSFDVEPDSVTVYMNTLSGEPGGDAALEPGGVLPLADDPEGLVYTVHAVWSGTHGCTGESYYAFCVKNP